MTTDFVRLWREDVQFLAEQLRSQHANVYHTVSQTAFDEAVASLLDRIPELSREKIIIEMAKIIAMIGDGHTSLWMDSNTSLGFHRYPLRFYEFSDGLVVSETDSAHRSYLGARLLHIGSFPVDDVLTQVQSVVSGDNDLMRRYKACAALNLPELLDALDITSESDESVFTLEQITGEIMTIRPPRLMPEAISEWVNLNQNATPLALQYQQSGRFYWFEHVEPHQIVYVNHRVVRNALDETIVAFCERLFDFIDANPVDRLVIDLRQNSGGDNRLNLPLIHGLICCRNINQRGKLFTLIGRHTFSAAMNLAVDLERHTQTLFAGEPTGASPNHYGENGDVILPNSGIHLTISIWYWQSSVPNDTRKWIEPQIRVGMSSADYRANSDPVLSAVLSYIS